MIALIPARGGSKGLPGKNIKLLNGKPLIVWTIEAALSARQIDRVFISTDDEAIASVGRSCGAEIPFLRPSELARDDSLAIDNYIYTMDRLQEEEVDMADEFVVLLPTCPLRQSDDIDVAIDLFCRKKADSVISVMELGHPVAWIKKLDPNGTLQSYFEMENSENNRQFFEQLYIPNGAVYVFRHSVLKEKYTYYTEKTYSYVMPRDRSIDIDTLIDFEFAEYVLAKRQKAPESSRPTCGVGYERNHL